MKPEGAFVSVSAGDFHSCGIRPNGTADCWGLGAQGQTSPPTGSFLWVSSGSYHACGLRVIGNIACWGYNDDGQASPPTGQFTAVDSGANFTMAVRGGRLEFWGG